MMSLSNDMNAFASCRDFNYIIYKGPIHMSMDDAQTLLHDINFLPVDVNVLSITDINGYNRQLIEFETCIPKTSDTILQQNHLQWVNEFIINSFNHNPRTSFSIYDDYSSDDSDYNY